MTQPLDTISAVASADASPLAQALARVGDRWTLLVVDALLDGPGRFGELEARVAGIAPNILTDRLRRLEREGLVAPRRYRERPPRLAYELTEEGRALGAALAELAAWGAAHGDGERPRHGCGAPLELRWWCPECGEPADGGLERA